MPKILVLLATYNGLGWLPIQCRSILDQAHVEVGLVSSDDRSSDGSYEYLIELERLDCRVKVLPLSERAGSAGLNFYRLIREADCAGYDFVAFADQDDTWYPDKLSRACDALTRYRCAGYSSAVRAVYPDGRTHELRQSPGTTPVDFIFEGAGQGCTFVFAGSFFEDIQRFVRSEWRLVREVHHHDWLTYAICRSRGRTWYFDSIPSVDYRQHAANELGGRGSLSGVSRRWGMLRSGWYGAQVEAVAEVVAVAGKPDALMAFTRERRRRFSLSGKLAWISTLSRIGRRKRLDRCVLAMAALLGYV